MQLRTGDKQRREGGFATAFGGFQAVCGKREGGVHPA